MKVSIEESYAGEFSADSHELEKKLHKATHVAMAKILDERLVKGQLRGGEVDVIDDLTDLMVQTYKKRMKRFRADAEKLLGEA